MKTLAKKVVIILMVAIMQIGLGTSIIEASPRYDDRNDNQRYEHRMERDRRMQEEHERHEREMMRREHEEEWEWHQRQEEEQRRHDETINEIKAGLIGFIIGRITK